MPSTSITSKFWFSSSMTDILFLYQAALTAQSDPGSFLSSFHKNLQASEAARKLSRVVSSRTRISLGINQRTSSSDVYRLWRPLAEPSVNGCMLVPVHHYKYFEAAHRFSSTSQPVKSLGEVSHTSPIQSKCIRSDVSEQLLVLPFMCPLLAGRRRFLECWNQTRTHRKQHEKK